MLLSSYHDITNKVFSENAKQGLARPIFKKKERGKFEKYMPDIYKHTPNQNI